MSVRFALVLLVAGCVPPAGRGEARERAFVSETGSANIAVVNLATGVVEKHIPTGFIPHNLVVSPDGAKLYVALAGSQSVAQIDVASESLSATWLTSPVPDKRPDGSVIQPHATDNAMAHNACNDCHRDGGAMPRYVGNRPVALRLSNDGARLYVCEINSGTVIMLDTTTGARLGAVTLAVSGRTEPSSIALLDGALYVTMRATQPTKVPGILRKLDPATLSVIEDKPLISNDPVELVAMPELHALLLTHFDSNKLSLITAAGETRSIEVANGPLGITPLPNGRVLVMGYYSNAVSIADLASNTAETFPLTLAAKPVSNPTHAALSANDGIAWVVSSGTMSRLVALDTKQRKITRSIALDGLSYDVAIVPVHKPAHLD